MPLLYSFVAVPFAFCVVALHLQSRFALLRNRTWLAALLAFAVGSGFLFVFLTWRIRGRQQDLFCFTHYPIFPVIGGLGLLLYFCLRKLIPEPFRPVALLAALASWAAANHQVLTGFFTVPHNYDQNCGVVGAALILVLALLPLLRYRLVEWVAFLAIGALAVDHARESYRIQKNMLAGVTFSQELLSDLKTNSPNCAVNNLNLATIGAMLFPKQPPTLLGHQNTTFLFTSHAFDHYQWAKAEINKQPDLAKEFAPLFEQLDHYYRYENDDFILVHSGRKTRFPQRHDPDSPPKELRYPPLQIRVLKQSN